MVLHCVQSDRQNVDSAIALFNESWGNAEIVVPKRWEEVVSGWLYWPGSLFKQIFNSRIVIDQHDSEKNAFGTDFKSQVENINWMMDHMYTIKFLTVMVKRWISHFSEPAKTLDNEVGTANDPNFCC